MPKAATHFKVHLSMPRHPNTIRVWLDNDMLACYVRLGIALIKHFADRTDDQMVVGSSELCRIAATEHAGGAVLRMRKLASMSAVEFLDPRCAQDAAKVRSGCAQAAAKVTSRCARVWVLGLPNFATKQGFGARKSKVRVPSASAAASAAGKKKKKSGADAPSVTVEGVWELAKAAAVGYGARWSKLTHSRRQTLKARLADYRDRDVSVAACAVHGFVEMHTSAGSFEWRRHMTPETIFRASKFPKYLEAYDVAKKRHAMLRKIEAEKVSDPPADLADRVGAREV